MSRPLLTWRQVLEEEYRALYGVDPGVSAGPGEGEAERLAALHQRIHERGPSALCLSGGGIRSATFALGVLQGLAYAGVLGTFDYLSTVSGGGYTGGWFTAWLRREGPAGRGTVLDTIDPGRATRKAQSDDKSALLTGGNAIREPPGMSPVEKVRRTCRYLAPQGGVVSADVWTLVTTMSRNLILNWFVILPILAAALMIPRLYYGGVYAVERSFVAPGQPCTVTGDAAEWSFLLALVCFIVAIVYAVLNLVGLGGRWSQGRFLSWFLVPTVAGAIAITFFWSAYPCALSLRTALVLASTIPGLGWIVIGATAGRVARRIPNDGSAVLVRVGVRTVLAAIASGPIMGVGAWWLGSFEFGFGPGQHLRELYAIFAVPLVLGLGLVQMMVFIGLASSEMDDPVLEWYSRCGAWVAIAAALWMAAGLLVFFTADLVELGVQALGRALSMDRRTTAAGVAALVPLLSSLAGLAARAGEDPGKPSAVRAIVQKLALPAMIFVLLSTIAWGDLRAAEKIEYHRLPAGTRCGPDDWATPPCHPHGAGIGENAALFGGLLAFGLIMSYFVPVNRFSLHGMYPQRLVRTFLGASRRDRHPNGFTGFDAKDDLCVHQLADVRPLHVICTTLNAVSSTSVGRHEKQSQSFTFTPLHVGNRELQYRAASEYGVLDGGGDGTGLSLGMALAVSGAAASPAMGMYSTKSRAFLLTLANARLGLWFGNPRSSRSWQRSEPPFSVGPLMRELLGLTTDHNPYVYLSDGGHYENLGLWEMVARRCRFIVVSDAGCDPEYTFDDLANAVRRIRLDLGIPIQFDSLDITKAGQNHGNPHAAIGRIRYAVVDGQDANGNDVPDGTILYLKATLSGDETIDVRNFSAGDPAFPHDSTADQFFDEARFESYRILGFHTVQTLIPGLQPVANLEALFLTAREALADRQRSGQRHVELAEERTSQR